jgi:hypothetical protein
MVSVKSRLASPGEYKLAVLDGGGEPAVFVDRTLEE